MQVDSVLSNYKLTNEQLSQIRDRLLEDLLKGLKSRKGSSLKMLPTFVRSIPNGLGV